MTVRLSTGLRNALAGTTGFASAFNAGVIHIYSGPQPATADMAVSGTLLGKVTLNGAAFVFGAPTNGLVFGSPANGTVAKVPTDHWKFNGLADGTAGWFRLMGNASDALGASTTLPRLDGSIGTSGADMILANLSITVGSPNTIDVFSYTFPA